MSSSSHAFAAQIPSSKLPSDRCSNVLRESELSSENTCQWISGTQVSNLSISNIFKNDYKIKNPDFLGRGFLDEKVCFYKHRLSDIKAPVILSPPSIRTAIEDQLVLVAHMIFVIDFIESKNVLIIISANVEHIF